MDREPISSAKAGRAPGLIIRIRGIVQGVGFRPFIYRLAYEHHLRGSVSNGPDGVLVKVSGEPADLRDFVRAIPTRRPPLARITALDAEPGLIEPFPSFTITKSRSTQTARTLIPPDVTVCGACLSELFDPSDRRYRYPFINCTDCGPRYTLIQGLPYDRPLTTMSCFTMCAACQAEYENPFDRRFHAQPNACPACGPQVQLLDASGRELTNVQPVEDAVRRLVAGEIVAVKGIGGFHLAVDGTSEKAVRRLRQRKHREEKPLAIMASSLARVEEFCRVSDEEAGLLSSPERPIVLLDKLRPSRIASSVAPGQVTLGVMLPYTPLHALLLDSSLYAIVLTSGNLSEEPIAYRNDEARQRLPGIADAFLVHNREIYRRADDSVARVMCGGPRLLRRARGYAPRPVLLAHELPSLLAVGGQLKNTICLTRGCEAFLSPHIGDLDNLETFGAFKSSVEHLSHALEVRPTAVAHDLHPDYLSTRWALEESGLSAIGVQHHHAHVAAVLAEHGLEGPAVGVVLDGTGYGTDGQIWGGEILIADLAGFERVAHFPYVPLLGGEVAVRETWRMALSWLYRLFGRDLFALPLPFVRELDGRRSRVLLDALESGLNWPLTSSCGRLFDAVAALCRVRTSASYEGQAALELEGAAEEEERASAGQTSGAQLADQLPPAKSPPSTAPDVIAVDPLVRAAVDEIARGCRAGEVAARFHRRLAEVLVSSAASIARSASLRRVALGGGCFQNRILLSKVADGLRARGLEVLLPGEVPVNDGGLALGQAAVAADYLRRIA